MAKSEIDVTVRMEGADVSVTHDEWMEAYNEVLCEVRDRLEGILPPHRVDQIVSEVSVRLRKKLMEVTEDEGP